MKDNDLLIIVLAFFLGFCLRKMMGGDRLIEGSGDPNESPTLQVGGANPRNAKCNSNSECDSGCCVKSMWTGLPFIGGYFKGTCDLKNYC